MPIWREWIIGQPPVRILGITRDPPNIARTYCERNGLELAFLAIPEGDWQSVEGTMTARTPVVSLFDFNGILRFRSHGADVALVESIVQASR
jgi:hypothetical protein